MDILIYLVTQLNDVILRYRLEQKTNVKRPTDFAEFVCVFRLKARTHFIADDERIELNAITKFSGVRC